MTHRRTRSTVTATLFAALVGGLLGAVPAVSGATPTSAAPGIPANVIPAPGMPTPGMPAAGIPAAVKPTPAPGSPAPGSPAAAGAAVVPARARIEPGPPQQVALTPFRAVRTTRRPTHVPAPSPRGGSAPAAAGTSTETGDGAIAPAPSARATTLTRTADIRVTYTGFSPVAQESFQSAVDIISTLITSSVPINVAATFTPIPPTPDGGTTLGSAGPRFIRPVADSSPQGRTFYPEALANELAARDINTAEPEVTATFNSTFLDWYFGTDGKPAFEEYDFKSVVLHEVWHGLGFVGSAFADDDLSAATPVVGEWGFATSSNPAPAPLGYDRFVRNTGGSSVLDTSLYPNPSVALGDQLVGAGLRFEGPNALRGNGGLTYPPLFAPDPFQAGSSFSHLDEATYPRGTANALMTPALSNGESIHTPGPVSLGVFKDLGWNTRTVAATPDAPAAVATSTGGATVSWTAPTDTGGNALTGYRVTASTGQSVEAPPTMPLTATFASLSLGTPTSFTVQAINEIGSSPVSPAGNRVTPSNATVPDAPTGVTATAANASAQVAWTAPSDGGSPITGYTVTASPGGRTCTTTGATGCTVTGLVNGTAHTFTVTATNAAGTSAASMPSAAATPSGISTVPEAPSAPTATAGAASAVLTWIAPANGGSAISGYVVTAAPGGRTCSTTDALTCTVTGLTNFTAHTFTVQATNAVGSSAASAPSSSVTPAPAGSRFVPLTPARILDTRNGTAGPVGRTPREVQVTGQGGVPVGATAVVMNLTSVFPTASTFVTAYPTGEVRPQASNLNPAAGSITPNLTVVKVGAGGRVSLYNDAGLTHLLADVAGYYTTGTGSSFVPLTPARILDSREGVGLQVGRTPREVQITGQGGVPAGATAVVMNLTAVFPTASTFVTAFPTGEVRPQASNLNPAAGSITPNLVVVKVGTGGKVSLYNDSGLTHLIADVAGYYTSTGSGFMPLTPARILDTRDGAGTLVGQIPREVQVTGQGGVPIGATAVVLNVTAVFPSRSTFVTAYPSGEARPQASNLNPAAGSITPNLVVVKVGANGRINLYNDSGAAHLIADVAGYYTD